MNKKQIASYINDHKSEIDALMTSLEVQGHINALYSAMRREIVAALPDTSSNEALRIEIAAMTYHHYFKHWVEIGAGE
ncbi:MAG: hypothetical protein Q8S44_07285 [Flavobacteriaceae bacterium]|nr:hypothetical protein [Flavobacteriaceae bacterium]